MQFGIDRRICPWLDGRGSESHGCERGGAYCGASREPQYPTHPSRARHHEKGVLSGAVRKPGLRVRVAVVTFIMSKGNPNPSPETRFSAAQQPKNGQHEKSPMSQLVEWQRKLNAASEKAGLGSPGFTCRVISTRQGGAEKCSKDFPNVPQ